MRSTNAVRMSAHAHRESLVSPPRREVRDHCLYFIMQTSTGCERNMLTSLQHNVNNHFLAPPAAVHQPRQPPRTPPPVARGVARGAELCNVIRMVINLTSFVIKASPLVSGPRALGPS
jgi:hypothetical protein